MKNFNTFKITENKISNAIYQAIEDHMNGDLEALNTIIGLSGLSSETVVDILNKYTISDYDGAFEDLMSA